MKTKHQPVPFTEYERVRIERDDYRHALEVALEKLSKFHVKGPKQVARAELTIMDALSLPFPEEDSS